MKDMEIRSEIKHKMKKWVTGQMEGLVLRGLNNN